MEGGAKDGAKEREWTSIDVFSPASLNSVGIRPVVTL